MYLLVINILLAFIPSLFLVIFFYRKDSQKKEPTALILKTFLLGFISVLPAALIEIFISPFLVSNSHLASTLYKAFIIAAVVEEGIKLIVIKLFIFNRKEFDEVADGILYTITVSLGFAFFENLFYSFGSLTVLLIRGLSAVPLHATASGIMGYFIGKSKFEGRSYLEIGFLSAVAIHGLYDFFLFYGGPLSLMVIPLLIAAGIILMKLYKKALEVDRYFGRS